MITITSACAQMCTCSCHTHFSQFWSPLVTDQGFENFNENSYSKIEQENINFLSTGKMESFFNPSEITEHTEGRRIHILNKCGVI